MINNNDKIGLSKEDEDVFNNIVSEAKLSNTVVIRVDMDTQVVVILSEMKCYLESIADSLDKISNKLK